MTLPESVLAINSWETEREAQHMAMLAPGKRIVELGAYEGFSAVAFLSGGALHVHSVDWHRGDALLGERDTLDAMWRNLERFGMRDRVTMHVGRCEEVLPLFRARLFDLAFIDGDHQRAVADTMLVEPLVRSGGQLLWHDRDGYAVPDAIRWAEERYGRRHRVVAGSLAILDIPEL